MEMTTGNKGMFGLVRRHSLILCTVLGLAVAGVSAGVVAASQGDSGATIAEAPRGDYTRYDYLRDDWKTFYYIVPTQEQADEITAAEAELQNTIMQNEGELPHRTIKAMVANTPELNWLVSSMMAEASPDTTQFVDLREPALPVTVPTEAIPQTEAVLPERGAMRLYQPYPCSEPDDVLALFPPSLLDVCN